MKKLKVHNNKTAAKKLDKHFKISEIRRHKVFYKK